MKTFKLDTLEVFRKIEDHRYFNTLGGGALVETPCKSNDECYQGDSSTSSDSSYSYDNSTTSDSSVSYDTD